MAPTWTFNADTSVSTLPICTDSGRTWLNFTSTIEMTFYAADTVRVNMQPNVL